ncbi:MAG: hypothetical protein ABIU85_02220 [Methylotenera sp.]
MITIDNIKTATSDELDEIFEATEYTDKGVAIGAAAAADQDLRRAAEKELGRRIYNVAN